jgi:hypothetical protein
VSEILIVSKTKMHNGCCISGIEIATRRPLRLLPPGSNHQPADSPLKIGEVWEANYRMRRTPAPFVEDADATLGRRLRILSVAEYVAANIPVVAGSTEVIYDGLLQWNPHKGYLEPENPTQYSTQFWRPVSNLKLYTDDGKSIFWEPDTKRRIPWVGVAEPPGLIGRGALVRLSLSRAFAGNLDHDVCWLQLSGVYQVS